MTYLVGPLPPPLNGQSVSFAMLCEHFRARGLPHQVVDFSAGRTRRDGEFSLDRLNSLIRPLATALGLIGRRAGNVYLTNAQSWAGFLKDAVIIAAARLGRHRLILHLKGGNYDNFYREQSRPRRFLIRRTLAFADRLIVLGEALREIYDFVPGYQDKVIVIPNGLPDEMPAWPQIVAAKAAGDGIRLLYLSNLIESKGYLDVLVAARHLVQDHHLDVRADFCGEFWQISDARSYASAEEARADFQRRVASYGLSARVVWHGTVAGEVKRELLARAHYFVLPTAYKYEGQPVSIIEAMAYGALVISTPFRTIPEMLDDGRAGLLVEAGRPEQIVQAILTCEVGSAAYRARVDAARRRCAEFFSRQRHLDRLVAAIEGKPAPREGRYMPS
jgi:glycosyltransferase involved in cell wall biosynthesis